MVRAELEASSSGIVNAFRDRNVSQIAVTGGIATLGFSVAAAMGSIINRVVGLDRLPNSRAANGMIAVSAAVAAMLQIKFFGPAYGGAMAIGSIVAVGAFLLLAIFGDVDAVSEFRKMGIGSGGGVISGQPDQLGDVPPPEEGWEILPGNNMSSGCSTCGGGTTTATKQAASTGHYR